MNCPICGKQMISRATARGAVFMQCQAYPRCPACCTTEVLRMLSESIAGEAREREVSASLRERSRVLSDKLREIQASGVEPYGRMPLKIGAVVSREGDESFIQAVAKLAIARSKKRRMQHAVRLEGQAVQGDGDVASRGVGPDDTSGA